ncbi:aromatic motif membrane protein [Mycoplasma sp. Ms02]|uniref:aromatic motif membrane protein n=1 Tax=Mycoplasma sp. Ms02 TaxID=353851 RepID=UPI001C89EF70|nr:aromatic motif membrane protein [Mycoplasma sp. Ms02]QZE12546.1 hypothetical protein K4L35_00960 [Mycoplasma sp. Ms02]
MNKLIFAFPLLLSGLSLTACFNAPYKTQSNQKLAEIAKKNTDAIASQDQEKVKTTNNIINLILNKAFKGDTNAIDAYKEAQKDASLLEKWKKLSAKLEKSSEPFYRSDLQEFYNQNWLFILQNIDKAYGRYESWYFLEPAMLITTNEYPQGIKHSDEYLNSLPILSEKQKAEYNYYPANNYWDELKTGEESSELLDATVFYLKKGKIILRFEIQNENEDPEMHMTIQGIYFKDAKTEVSISLFNNLYHNAVLHSNDIRPFREFEVDLIKNKRYGQPATVLLLMRGANEN